MARQHMAARFVSAPFWTESRRLLCRLLVAASAAMVGSAARAQEKDNVEATSHLQVHAADFSNAYWLNGWKKAPKDTTPDILCIETGRYGLALDVNDLPSARFGLLDTDTDYERSHATGTQRLESLPPAELAVEVELDGTTYRAMGCGRRKTRMWESGRIAQHFDFQDLAFRDDAGNPLPCYGTLDMVAWPGSLTFMAEASPDQLYVDGPVVGVGGNGLCVVEKPFDIPHKPELEPGKLTVECWVRIPERMDRGLYGWMLCKNGNEWAQGNYGFMFRGGAVLAVLNNAGGRDQQTMIGQRGKFPPNKWVHLALTFDGKTMAFYMDGRQQGKKTIEKARLPGKGRLRIGQRADGNFKVVNGLYDQVRVWNRALTGKEIRAHTLKPESIENRTGLVLQEGFDSGETAHTPAWQNAKLRIGLKGGGGTWEAELRVDGSWKMGEKRQLSLTCNVAGQGAGDQDIAIQVSTPDGQTFPAGFDVARNCQVATVKGLKRSFGGGWAKITDYDEFDIVLDCGDGTVGPIPFLLDFYNPANITGLVPILCHPDGTPTGVPVQLSKNWHYTPTGAYLRAYALIPVRPGENHYRLRIVYGFYGTLPSASHAQLCLVGYGGNQRWDQLALASGGEIITFDADMSLTNVAVCDVRLAMGRNGTEGNPWGWTDAGWGGDWLGIYADGQWKLTFAGMKTTYLSHGPCLSDVLYKGAYGSGRDVLVDARVQLPRTDDYGRTFQDLTYRFQRELPAADTYFLRRHARAFDRVVAYGNAEGLIAQRRVAGDLKQGDFLIPPTELTGPGPWWIAFPGRTRRGQGDWGFGYVSLIIRDYESSFGGTIGRNPFFQARVEQREEEEAKLETRIVPPPGVTAYGPGDRLRLDTEWIHLVTKADDFGGPSEAYRQHLAENPGSWKTTYREAKGNELKIDVEGGKLLRRLPIVVQTHLPTVSVALQGGVGHVPIRFEGLKTAAGYALYESVDGNETKLDQSVHGNDFWQTDYDPGTATFRMTFNLPLDGKATSRWILRRREP